MKRLVLLSLVSTLALAAPPKSSAQILEFNSTQNLTGSSPASATDGLALAGTLGFRVSVCANTSQTLSGAGTLLAWVYVPTQAHWARDPSLDLAVTATTQCQAFPDLSVYIHKGQVKYVPNGITVSAGTTVAVLIEAVQG